MRGEGELVVDDAADDHIHRAGVRAQLGEEWLSFLRAKCVKSVRKRRVSPCGGVRIEGSSHTVANRHSADRHRMIDTLPHSQRERATFRKRGIGRGNDNYI